jgi:hypothetical protein
MAEEENFLDTFVCSLKEAKSITDWFQNNQEECPPCTLGVLANFYAGMLQDAGEIAEHARLEEAFESGDPLTVAKELDRIKAAVREPLRESLLKLDCFSQTLQE